MKKTKISLIFLISPILLGTLFSCSNNVVNHSTQTNTINRDVKINDLNILQSTTSKEFFDKYNNNVKDLKEFVYENINRFISFETKQIKDNFSVVIESYDREKVILKITILKSFWYENNILNNDKDLIGYSNIIGFNNIDNNVDDNESIGGTLDGGQLSVDRYKKFVEFLNLKKTTNISSITNEKILEEIKKNPEFKDIVLKIGEDSNTEKGILFLDISGSYNNKNINPTKITISNFVNNQDYKLLELRNIKLNLEQWFNDLKPIDTIESNLISEITTEEWIGKYFEYLSLVNSNNSIVFTLKEIKEYGIKFKNLSINVLNDKKNINFVFNGATFQNKTFQNGNWINKNIISIGSIWNITSTKIPNESDAINFLGSKTIINDDIIKNYYPSYFSGLAEYAKKYNLNYYPTIQNLINNDFKEKIKNKYFKQKEISINIDFSDGSIFSDDFNSTLSFYVSTSIVGESNITNKIKKFEFNNILKNLNDFFEREKLKENNILLLPPSNNNIAQRFISQLKKDQTLKNKIDSFFKAKTNLNEEVKTNISSIIPFRQNLLNSTYVYGNEKDNVEENFDRIFTNDFEKTIFSENVSNSNNINFSDVNSKSAILIGTGLFKYDNDTIFKINSIRYFMDSVINNLIFIKGNNPNLLTIKVPLKTIIGFNNYKILEQNSFFVLHLLKNQWNNN